MDNKEFAQSLRHGFFATRDNVKEAFDYAYMLAKASENPTEVLTAVHVVVNAIADQIERNEEEALANFSQSIRTHIQSLKS